MFHFIINLHIRISSELTSVWVTDDKRSGALPYGLDEGTHLRRSESAVQTNAGTQRETQYHSTNICEDL